jgi:hypothetical protein
MCTRSVYCLLWLPVALVRGVFVSKFCFFAAHGHHHGSHHHGHHAHRINAGPVWALSLGPNTMVLLSGQAAVLTDGSQQIFLRATPVVQQCCSATTFGTFDENAISNGARQLFTVDEYRYICRTLNEVEDRHRKPAVAWLFALWIGEYFLSTMKPYS